MITRSDDALRAQASELRQAAFALGIVDFNERKQEFFCRACRYRDPLWPDGNKLHDDECPYLHFLNVLESLDAALVAARDEGQPQWRDISSAPKAYQTVLVSCEPVKAIATGFVTEKGIWRIDGWDHLQPTHWMPLPAPPVDQKGPSR